MTGCLPLLLVLFASPACGLWTVPIREADVIKVGDDFGAALHSWSCEVLRSGTNSRCSLPGLTDVYASLMTEGNGLEDMPFNLRTDVVEQDLAEQVSEAFGGMDKALRVMQTEMARFVLDRLRVESLSPVNYSAKALYDASHPRFKTDLVNTTLENTEFFVPVERSSTLQYPTSIDRNDRQVRIVANASFGLDESFMAVLHDNADAVMTAIRWQRFTSDTGITRQFPATFDDSGRDERFETWYCQTTQVPKRVLLLLDMSESMGGRSRVETGKETVLTILRTLTAHDSINVQLIAGSSPGLPSFAPLGLVAATAYNIARLTEFVQKAKVMGQQDVAQSLSDALTHLDVVDFTHEATSGDIQEDRPAGIKQYVFLISDGELLAADQGERQTRLDGIYREIGHEFLQRTHVMTVAVGQAANEAELRLIACKMNGLFFNIPTPEGHSATRTKLSKWYQMVAAPLAPLQADGSLAATWTKPYLSRSGNEVYMTAALPCFVDLESDQPHLMGAVALDIALSAKGEAVWRTLLPWLQGLRPRTRVGVAALKQGLQISLLLRQANEGVVLSNSLLLSQYTQNANSSAPLRAMQHELLELYEDAVFREQGVLDKLLASDSGTHTTRSPRVSPGSTFYSDWDLTPIEQRQGLSQDTKYAWKRLPQLPVSVFVSLPTGTDGTDKLKVWTADALETRPASKCDTYASAPEVQAALRRPVDANALCDTPRSCITCGLASPLDRQMDSAKLATVFIQRGAQMGATGKGSNASQPGARDVLVLPLAVTSANTWLASSPAAAAQRAACRTQPAPGNSSPRGERQLEEEEIKGQQDVCADLVKQDLAHELDLTAPASLLWAAADNMSSATTFPRTLTASYSRASPSTTAVLADFGWRGTRFVTSTVGIQRLRLAAIDPEAGAVRQELLDIAALTSPMNQRPMVNAHKAAGRLSITPAAAPSFHRTLLQQESGGGVVRESVLTVARALPTGDPARASDTVVGGEVSRRSMWEALYLQSNNGLCSKQGSQGQVRCYLINEGGAILLAPEDASATCASDMSAAGDGCGPTSSWPQELVFFADREPATAEFLATHGYMTRFHTLSLALRADVTGSKIENAMLPAGPLRVTGAVSAEVYLREVEGTDAYLVVLADYRVNYPTPTPRATCGVLSTICKHISFPAIVPLQERMTQGEGGWSKWSPKRAVRALPGRADALFMIKVRLDSYCAVPTPSWVTLLGWCTTGIIFLGLGFVWTYRKRVKRIASSKYAGEEKEAARDFQAKILEEEERSISLVQRVLYELGFGSGHEDASMIKDYVARKQQRLSRLTQQAQDMQDMTFIVYEQAALLHTISEAKQGLVQALQGQLQRLAVRLVQQAALAKNLLQRTELQESGRPSAAVVRESITQVRRTLERVEQRVDWLKMPPVKVVETADAAAKEHFEGEREFYNQHYPHVIQYSTYDGTSVSRRSARASAAHRPTSPRR